VAIRLSVSMLAAARQAKIPKPPSQAVYEVFKNAPLDFKP
jgi:colicin import membrane protein